MRSRVMNCCLGDFTINFWLSGWGYDAKGKNDIVLEAQNTLDYPGYPVGFQELQTWLVLRNLTLGGA